ncbi:MAG: DUF4132 domain-containing protein [Myxococcota bacterium]|jgi:hypothetical protein|nr:DUF4132 domain-containing protein [Myxococcota bacterium]
MSKLHWTPEARARASSLREPTLAPVDVEAGWASLRRATRQVAEPAPELAGAFAALVGALGNEAPPEALDVDAVAVGARILRGGDLVGFVIARFGLVRAVEAWLRSRELSVIHGKPPRVVVVVPPGLPVPWALTLRAHLPRADAAVRDTVHHLLAPFTLGSGATHPVELAMHAHAVTLFPEELDWSRSLAARFLAGGLAQGHAVVSALHRSSCPLDLVLEVTRKAEGSGEEYESLLAIHGEDAVPRLLELLDALKETYAKEAVARALTIVCSPEVAAKLAEHLGKQPIRRHLDAYFQRFPELAADALRPAAERKGRLGEMAKEMLTLFERASTPCKVSDEASLGELPSVLAQPPWRGTKRKRKPLVVESLGALDGPRAWHGNRSPAVDPSVPRWATAGWSAMDDAEVRAWLAQIGSPERLWSSGDAVQRKAPPDWAQLEAWNLGAFVHEHTGTLRSMLEAHGLDAAKGALAWATRHLARTIYAGALAPLSDLELPELAPAMALALSHRESREVAARWLRRFPRAAMAGLLPVALGPLGAPRTAAERALRAMVRDGHDPRPVLDGIGDGTVSNGTVSNGTVSNGTVSNGTVSNGTVSVAKTALAALDEVLAWDPRADCPAKPPKLSTRYRPEALVRPTLRDGRPLPLEAVVHLDEMLVFSPMDPPYAGLDEVREACDPRSLAEHAWSLARAWETSGARKADDWMMRSLVHLADDEVVRRMTPALKNKLVVEVLVAIGTDAAAMELATIGAGPRGQPRTRGARGGVGMLRELAEAALDRIAEARGLDRDRLDERLTPSFGLDAQGSLQLDFGARTFRVVFDEHLVPQVRGEDGKVSTTLPRARKDDDPEKVEAARKIWDELREDVAAIGVFRIQALERAMLSGVTWSVEDFEAAWVKHPLMTHLARRMVFVAFVDAKDVSSTMPDVPSQASTSIPAPSTSKTFRVAEDGTYVGVDHDTVVLEPDARVGIPHPLAWPDGSRPAWEQMLADYEIVQPFAQVTRPTPAIEPSWLESPTIVIRAADEPDLFPRRRRLVTCGWNVTTNPHRLALDDGFFVLARGRSITRGAERTYETELVLRRGTDEVAWREVPRTTLLRVIDAFT